MDGWKDGDWTNPAIKEQLEELNHQLQLATGSPTLRRPQKSNTENLNPRRTQTRKADLDALQVDGGILREEVTDEDIAVWSPTGQVFLSINFNNLNNTV